jgi:hypothetical protein
LTSYSSSVVRIIVDLSQLGLLSVALGLREGDRLIILINLGVTGFLKRDLLLLSLILIAA